MEPVYLKLLLLWLIPLASAATCDDFHVGTCPITENNIIDLDREVDSPELCQLLCRMVSGCEFFTHYETQCYMLNSCDIIIQCEGCVSGPPLPNYETCTSPPETTTTPATTTTPPVTTTTTLVTTTSSPVTTTTPQVTTTSPPDYSGIILIGGLIDGTITNDVELIGNCNSNIQDIPVALKEADSAVVADGSVYLCGGILQTETASSKKCYIREPSGVWRAGPQMRHDRAVFTLNLYGSQLVAIGGNGSNGREDTVEVLEVGSSNWVLQSFKIDPPRSDHCAVSVSQNGNPAILIAGGNTGEEFLRTTQLLQTGPVTQLADLPVGVSRAACALVGKRVMLTGGITATEELSSAVYTLFYEAGTNQWQEISPLVHSRRHHTMAVVDGIPTVYGGAGSSASYEEYVDGTWRSKQLSKQRNQHSMAIIC